MQKLAPHDLRRTYARLCHLAGGELEQILFLLGHASVQTTERYLGCKQRLVRLQSLQSDFAGVMYLDPPCDRTVLVFGRCLLKVVNDQLIHHRLARLQLQSHPLHGIR